jgi:hypothetical protein
MSKDQNLRMPILDAVAKLNRHGLEVVSGIIIGLDTDTPDTADHLIEFVRASHIPVLTINLLYALPKTPLWRRLQAEGRLLTDGDRESNVVFKLPYETVLESWLRCIRTVYEPEAVYARFAHNVTHTFPNRIPYPHSPHRGSWRNVVMGFSVLARVIWRVGLRGDYRRTFWRFAAPRLRRGDIEQIIQTAVVSHHLIAFTRQCLDGAREPSFYAPVTTPGGVAIAG